MKKRFISLFLVLVLLIGMAPFALGTGSPAVINFGFSVVVGPDGQPLEGALITAPAPQGGYWFHGTSSASEPISWWRGLELSPDGWNEITVVLEDVPGGLVFNGMDMADFESVFNSPYWDIYWGPGPSFTITIKENLPPGQNVDFLITWGFIPASHSFTDVPGVAWEAYFVDEVYRGGIMNGTSPTTFSPNAGFSREMVVATLFRMYHGRSANASDPRATPFDDVSTNAWSAPYIAWALREGIVTGVSPTRFDRGTPISYQDFAVMLHRFANFSGIDTSVPDDWNLSDFPPEWFPYANYVGAWAEEAFTWTLLGGIFQGLPQGPLAVYPPGLSSRADAAAILAIYVRIIDYIG